MLSINVQHLKAEVFTFVHNVFSSILLGTQYRYYVIVEMNFTKKKDEVQIVYLPYVHLYIFVCFWKRSILARS